MKARWTAAEGNPLYWKLTVVHHATRIRSGVRQQKVFAEAFLVGRFHKPAYLAKFQRRLEAQVRGEVHRWRTAI